VKLVKIENNRGFIAEKAIHLNQFEAPLSKSTLNGRTLMIRLNLKSLTF